MRNFDASTISFFFFFSSRRRHTRYWRDWSSDVCSSDLATEDQVAQEILWEGTHTGPMETPGGTLPPSGAQISVEASLWVRFHGDKAREVHHYLDVLSLLQQIGAIPREP